MNLNPCNIGSLLVLAPHTDDGEFGCGATIAKCARLGTRVDYVAFLLLRNLYQQDFLEISCAMRSSKQHPSWAWKQVMLRF